MNKRFFNQQNLTRRLRLLSVLFAMLLMPLSAWAEDYGFSIGGVAVGSGNIASFQNSGVSYDADSKTLTLENATIDRLCVNVTSGFIIDLKGKNTITASTDTAAIFSNINPTASLPITIKSSSTPVGSLTITPRSNSYMAYSGVSFTYQNGLSLIPDAQYLEAGQTAVVGVSYGLTVGDVPVTNANASDILADIEYFNGKVSFTVEDNKNVLILDGANLMEYPIVSDLTNLTIRFKDDCSLFTITSNKTNATLRFEKAEDAGDGTQLTGSGLGGSPWSGFGGGVTFGGSLAYLPNSDTWYIYNLPSPNISVENNAVSFSYNNITNVNDFNFFYTLQYEDENQQSVTTFTQYDPQNPLTINKASVLTVKARYKYAEDYSDVSIGKYFGAAEDPMRLVYGADPVDFVLAPAIEEGDGIIINGIEANVTYNTGKVSSSTLGRNGANVSLGYVDANNKTTTLLNNYFNMSFDVVPPAPTIGLAEGTYSSTHEAITVTSDGLENTTIKYQWDDDDEEDYPETGIPFQAGTLKAWVVYTSGETSLSSDIVSATYTVLSEAGLQYVVGDDPVEDVDYVIGGTGNELTLPTLLNPHNVSVTYASGNTAIATVAADGTVTPVGVGSTTITATSEQTSEYTAGEATYWLNVYKSLSHSSITVEISAVTYNGQAQTPTVIVKDGDDVLPYGEDDGYDNLLYAYKVEFANNTNAALATAETNAPTATITALTDGSVSHMEVNWYRGSTTKTFTISPMSISTATVSVDATQTYTYTGSEIKPSVLVSIYLTENAENITTLTEGTDYTVTGYANNTNAATATSENVPTITITGKGNFTGTATGTFTIDQASLGDVTIAPIADQAYTGDQITPAVTVTFNDAAVSTEDYNVVYGENTNAGENAGTVTLTSKNKNFVTSTDEDATTKKTATFNIVAATAAITATDQTVTFNGGAQEFTNYTIANGTPRVTYYSSEEARAAQSGGTTSAPTNADTYYVQVTQVNNNYTSDPADATFTISPMTLTSEMVTLSATSFVYSGAAQTPDVTVADGDNILTINTNYDYVIKQGETVVASPMNVGSYSVVVTGKGNYSGTATQTFTIAAKDLASATVTVDATQTYTYTGAAIEPNVSSVSIKLTEGADVATNLTAGTDYTVTGYANNTDAALATAETNAPTVTITGKGNFTGTATGTFTIAQAKLSAVTIAAIDDQTFTGSQITPAVTVTFNEKTVSTDEYNVVYGENKNVGENAGTVTLTSKNKNFVTSTDEDATTKKTATFNIVAAAAAITATDQTVTFDGEERPFTNYTIANGEAVVTYYSSEEARTAQSGGTTSAPTEAAIYYVQVTQGDDNYTSAPANATFTISPMTLTSEMVTLSATSFVYSGAAQTPDVTVADGDNILTINTNYDYVIKQGETVVASPMNVGSYSVVVTGKGNYTGTATKTFTIAAKDLASATVTVDPNQTYTYTGSAITPNVSSVSIKLTEGADAATNLTSDDYTVTGYANNTDAALATAETNAPTVTITGKGNFTGTATGTFTIAQAKLSAVTIAAIGNQTFTGSQITPGVTVTFNEKTVSTDEYNVVYGDNINAGENAGTVTLTSKNKNFVTSTDEDATTKKTATFNIVAATAAITATDQTVTFNGEEQPFTSYTIANGEAVVTYYSSEEARTAQSGGTTSAPTEAAIYYVQVTQGDDNYTSAPANATFTISPKALTEGMVEQDGVSFTYSGYTPEYSVSVKDGEEYLAGDDYDCVIKQGGTEIIPVNAGSYDVVVTGKRNYTGTITKTLTITQAQLTVTPDDKTYNVGDDITLTVSYEGFVNGETETVLTTQPTASCDADVTKPGSYEITASGGVAQNYDFIYKTGTLTINRQLNVSFSASNTWATYCGTENLSTPEGLKAYQVTAVEGATVTISEIGYIPANTAVLLQNVSNNNTWSNIAASAYTGATLTFASNKLIGTASDVDVSTISGGTVYVLYNNMFKRATGGTIPANRGYLVVEPSAVNAGNAPQLSISIGDENTTGVQTLNVERGTLNDDSWYTIDGRKLQQAPVQKGLYIKNGKKVFINKK